MRPSPYTGDALPMRGFAVCILRWNESLGEASLLGGELALPHWGGSHQPLDRQVRYYSEARLLARAFCGSRRAMAFEVWAKDERRLFWRFWNES